MRLHLNLKTKPLKLKGLKLLRLHEPRMMLVSQRLLRDMADYPYGMYPLRGVNPSDLIQAGFILKALGELKKAGLIEPRTEKADDYAKRLRQQPSKRGLTRELARQRRKLYILTDKGRKQAAGLKH